MSFRSTTKQTTENTKHKIQEVIQRSPIIGVIRTLINYCVLGTCHMGDEVLGAWLMKGYFYILGGYRREKRTHVRVRGRKIS
jgi:hypothetical protein